MNVQNFKRDLKRFIKSNFTINSIRHKPPVALVRLGSAVGAIRYIKRKTDRRDLLVEITSRGLTSSELRSALRSGKSSEEIQNILEGDVSGAWVFSGDCQAFIYSFPNEPSILCASVGRLKKYIFSNIHKLKIISKIDETAGEKLSVIINPDKLSFIKRGEK